MAYVDGFVIPVPKRRLKEYLRQARFAGKIWKEHGALEFRECAADDLPSKVGGSPVLSFRKLARLKRGETVMFSFIVYRSRAHRDRVNRKAMKDPRMTAAMEGASMPFEPRRMAYGGFRALVDL